MSKKYKLFFLILATVGVLILFTTFLLKSNIAVFNPKGIIAAQERDLMVTAILLMLIIVIPVFTLTFFIAWKYRASNTKAKYSPDWDGNRVIEFTWWAVPTAIIVVLAVITWKATHRLDPFRPLESTVKPVKVQVVALQWKWLFIYPEQNIASINFIQFPEDTPINFEITADAPMNSFWIPQLGGQVYAMAGMKTKLHLMANEPGSYNGSSANISGRGFASMNFIAKASSHDDFSRWVQLVQQSPNRLSLEQYHKLAKPSQNTQPLYYSSTEEDLLDTIVMKFMTPTANFEANSHDRSSNYEANHH